MTAEQLAAALGISRTTVYRWKTHPHQIFLSNLIAVADYFNCSLEFLLGRTEINQPDANNIPGVNNADAAPEAENAPNANTAFDAKNTPKNKPPDFSRRLRAVMKEKGISTYYMRKVHRYNSMYFRKWASGSDLTVHTVIELASILNCTVDYLVGREE
jgi:transcriptional regulator with XRE-family HTH domain